MSLLKQFGGKATPAQTARYSQSAHWRDDKFMNLETTSMEFSLQTLPTMLYKQFFEKNGREPEQPLPVVPFDKAAFGEDSNETRFIWYGHSVLLLRMNQQTLLIDPMLGPNASPIAPFATKRFSNHTLGLIDDFPEIDLLILTHDHYDHLDLHSIEQLKPKVKKYFVAIGVGRHLVSWGIAEEDITEFDWWEQRVWQDIHITFTPTRHFSGRGLTDRARSLWGGWVFRTEKDSIWFSGDGGYGAHFQEIGKRLGPFDFAFMECGQYNENWHQIHLYPEESVQAALDAGAKKALPVHWGAFSLAQHHWKDPVVRFVEAAEKHNLPIVTPPPGALFSMDSPAFGHWWNAYV